MTFETAAMIVAGAAAGGFMNGLAGFGTALFALGFFLEVMTATQAVSLVVILAVVSGLQGVYLVRDAMFNNTRRLMRFLLPALVGIPLGIYALAYLEAHTLKLVIGFFLVLYGGFFAFRRNLPQIEGEKPVADMVVGFAGGILGGAASLSGALPTMWCSMRPWPKAETRAVLQPFNVAVLSIAIILFWLRGAYTHETLYHLAIAVPASLIAAQLGITVFKRLNDGLFRRLLILLTFFSGAILLSREAMAMLG